MIEGDTETVIGDARYVVGEDGETAEFAIAVVDAWQGQGIATRLRAALGRAARETGLLLAVR